MVSLTGQVDAPFAFNFLFPVPAKEFRAGAVGVAGVYVTTPNDVYFISREGPRSIGSPVVNKYLRNLSGTYAQTGFEGRYDVFKQLYYVMIPQASPTSTEILVYHDKWQCWTSFNYPVVASAFCVHNAPVDPNFPTTVPIRGPVLITNEGSARVIYESAATTTDIKTSGTQNLTATAVLAAQRPVDFKRRVKIEEITIDTDGGEANSFIMAATLFVPSTYGGTAVETITYGGSVAITSNKLRARSQIRSTYEREGFVPQVVVTGAPSLVINEIDTLIQDGSPIIGNSGDRARITVTGSYRAITDVSGSIRVIT